MTQSKDDLNRRARDFLLRIPLQHRQSAITRIKNTMNAPRPESLAERFPERHKIWLDKQKAEKSPLDVSATNPDITATGQLEGDSKGLVLDNKPLNDTKSAFIVSAFSLVPYCMLCWGYAVLVNGGLREFWSAFGVLFLTRLVFGLIEMFGGALAWRLYSKRQIVDKLLGSLRANKFPPRIYADDDLSNYLARIKDGDQYPEALRNAAKEWQQVLAIAENIGILCGMRTNAALEDALELYSPRIKAPVFK